MIKEEEQLIQKLRNDLLAGADTMISTGHNTEDELFPLFCKLFPDKSEKEVKGIYIATATKCELVYGAPCEAINTFDAMAKLYLTYRHMKADEMGVKFPDDAVTGIYNYVYFHLYKNTLSDFYQRASAISLAESLDHVQDLVKHFAFDLERCGLKYADFSEIEQDTYVLEGERRYKLEAVTHRKSEYPKVTSRVSYLTIGYDMFTLKFKELTD